MEDAFVMTLLECPLWQLQLTQQRHRDQTSKTEAPRNEWTGAG